jgi:molybdopterin synthase catalytic subunit
VIVHLKLFAVYRERVGARALDLELPEGATAGAALAALQARHPAVTPLRDQTVYAVNEEYASPDTPLHEGDEVAFIPPVSGG